MRFVLEIDIGENTSSNDVATAVREVAGRIAREVPWKPVAYEQSIYDQNNARMGWWAFAEGWSVQKDPVQR